MIELQTVTTKAKNPSTNEFQDVTWGGINVLSTSGTTNYNNLTNKPTINGVTVQGSLTTGDLLITAADVGALSSGTKYGADFALSIDSQTFVVTAQLKDQDGNNLGQAKTIDLPLETMVVGGSYNDTTQKIILTLKNGQTVEFSVADLVSGLQSEITLSNKLDADLVSDVSSENKFVTAAEKTTWNGKQSALTFDGTYDSSTNKVATVSTVTTAINDLDVSSVGGSGKYISEISETNGKISATVETMDTVPTSGSTKAVTSGGVQAPLAEVIDNGAKNRLNITLTSGSGDGLTWTVNDDLSVTVSGKNTGGTLKQLHLIGSSYIQNAWKGQYLSGVSGGSLNTYKITAYYSNNGSTYATEQTFYSGALAIKENDYIRISLEIAPSYEFAEPYTFKPMICTAADYAVSPTFVPYGKTNAELTNENASQQSEINCAVNAGVKNLLDVQHPTTTTRTSYTPLANGGVELSCSNATWTSYAISDIPVEAGKEYIITFLLDESSGTSNFYFFLRDGNSSGTNLATKNYGSTTGKYEALFTPDNSVIWLGIYLNNSATAATATAKLRCMIRPAYITDSTYQPYALPNPVITPALIKQVDEGAKNIADFTSTTKTTYTTATFHGVTITRNGDIFTISGTSDTNDNAFFNIYYEGSTTTKIIPPGNWVALIEDYTGSVVKDIAVQVAAPAVPPAKPYGTPIKFSLSGSESGNWLRVNVRPSTTYDGSFRLMICSQEDYAISPAFVPYPVLTPALIEQVDSGAKNLLNLNTDFTTYTNKGITYENNSDGTIKVSGTSSSGDSYITLYDRNTDNLFGIQKGETVVIRSTSDNVSVNLIYKKSGGGYGLTVYGYKSSPSWFTVPSDFAGFLLRIGVPRSGTTVNENVGGMICTAANYAVSPIITPYLKPYSEIGRLGYYIETVALNSVTITKSVNGIFYTSAIDVSDKFDLLLGATLNNFGNLQSNIAIMPAIKPADKTYSLWICDSTNPQTLPVSEASQVKVVLYGITKGF